MVELKPCPFCGCTPTIKSIGYYKYYVKCDNGSCGVHPETYAMETKGAAVNIWNSRAGHEQETVNDTAPADVPEQMDLFPEE